MNLKSIPAPAWYLFGAAVVGFLGYRFVKDGAKSVAGAFDPTSHDNVFASGVNGVGAALTGDDSWTLGGAFADLFGPSDPGGFAADRAKLDATASATVTKTPYANPDNANAGARSSVILDPAKQPPKQ